MVHNRISIEDIQKDIDSGIREYVHDHVSVLKKRLAICSDREQSVIRRNIKHYNRLLKLR